MRIGIYADLKYGLPGGVQQYIEKITLALVKDPSNELFIITNEEFYNRFFDTIQMKNIHFLLIPNEKSKAKIKEDIYKLALDVLHFPFQYFPIYDWKIPTVITLHDLQHEYFPEFFTKAQLNFRKYNYKKSALLCDQIIVSFNHVKEDICKHYNIPYEKVSVTSLGFENRFSELSLINKQSLKNKFNIPEHFILYPAQTWKHKNHLGLFKALQILKVKYKRRINLVCTGALNDYYESLEEYIKINGLADQIKFLGFISNDELYSLYCHTDLVVIPTLYEAGSFPLLEAMSLEKPVICSNVTSLPETIGDLRFTFNPNDPEEIASNILNMLIKEDYILQNKLNSRKQIKRFNWEDVCKKFIMAYKNAIINSNANTYNKDCFTRIYSKLKRDKIAFLNKLFSAINNSDKVMIYGAGEHTRELLCHTNIRKKNIQYIVDKNAKAFLVGYEVLTPEQIMVFNPDVVVISSFSYQDEIFHYIKTVLNYKGRIIRLYDKSDMRPFYYL